VNKIRKLAEDLVAKHPTLFSTDFSENKQAIEKVMIIRNRALRNQIAGAISTIIKERSPKLASQEPPTQTIESGSIEQQTEEPSTTAEAQIAQSASETR